MIVECKHCYTKIIPRKDNTCPSCGISLEDNTDKNEDLTSLTIGEAQKLPNICYMRGQKSNKVIRISRNTEQISRLFLILQILLFILFLPAGFIFLYLQRKNNESKNFSIDMPICLNCKKNKILQQPTHIDLENCKATFIVHSNFKREYKNII